MGCDRTLQPDQLGPVAITGPTTLVKEIGQY